MQDRYEEVVAANQRVHTALAHAYNTAEPHFRPENVAHVEAQLATIFKETNAGRLLDLGCGTGFIIEIAKKYVAEIDGVDVTEAMISRVDKSGPARIQLHLADTGSFETAEGSYDAVTAYSFLHHLFDPAPTFRTAARALRPGGKFFAGLEPNFYYWQAIKDVCDRQNLDSILAREVQSVMEKDDEIQKRFGVDQDTFNTAEYNKNITGGFREEDLTVALLAAGFSNVKIDYYWFLGQAAVVNEGSLPKAERITTAKLFAATLQRGLPLTRHLFKYLGFVATR